MVARDTNMIIGSYKQHFFKKEDTSVKETGTSIMYSNYAININVIIGSMMVVSMKTL